LRFALGNDPLQRQPKLALGLATLVVEHRAERLEQPELDDRGCLEPLPRSALRDRG